MTVDIFLRVGRGRNGIKTAAGVRPNPAALTETRNGSEKPIPTFEVKLKLQLTSTAFAAAEMEIPLDDELLQAKLLSIQGAQ